MKGYGVDWDAPRMPFVTANILSRPFKPLWHLVKWSWATPYNAFSAQPQPKAEEDPIVILRRLASTVLPQTMRPTWEADFDDEVM